MGEAAESRLTQLHEGTPGLAWCRGRVVRRKSTSGGSATGPVSRRATSAPSHDHRADEPPGPQAPGNKLALSSLAPRAFPDAPRECGVPTPPCSALRLLSSLVARSLTHALAHLPLFAVAVVARATHHVYRRKHNQPGIN